MLIVDIIKLIVRQQTKPVNLMLGLTLQWASIPFQGDKHWPNGLRSLNAEYIFLMRFDDYVFRLRGTYQKMKQP